MHEMSLVTSFYLGFCTGAILIGLVFTAVLTIASWRERKQARKQGPLQAQIQTQAQEQEQAQEQQSMAWILDDYAPAFELLSDYDQGHLSASGTTVPIAKPISYEEAMRQITLWKERGNVEPLFGNAKDNSFRSALEQIEASFDGGDLYPSVEEKAANLLYGIVKNHAFSDGNKRIGAAFFVWFLQRNQCLYDGQGQKRITDQALVAITLLLAQSDPAHRDHLMALVVSLIRSCGKPE